MSVRPVLLPVPRVILGEKAGSSRSDGPRRHAVIETVPVPVREVDPAQAPVVLRLDDPVAQARPRGFHPVIEVGPRSWRAHAGRLYSPLFERRDGGATPEAAAAMLGSRASEAFPGMPMSNDMLSETVIDYRAAFSGTDDKARPAEGGPRLRSVSDAGEAERDRIVAGLAEDLILVDGVLHHRSPAPYYEIGVSKSGDRHVLGAIPRAPYARQYTRPGEDMPVFNAGRPGRRKDPLAGTHAPWMAFEPWRVREARAYAAAAVGYRGVGAYEDGPAFEVVDEAALRAAVGEAGVNGDLLDHAARAAAAFVEIAAPDLHRQPDATILALLETRRAIQAARAGGAGPEDVMEAARGFARGAAAGLADMKSPAASKVEDAARLMLLRYDEFERPYAGLDPGGEAMGDLAGLMP